MSTTGTATLAKRATSTTLPPLMAQDLEMLLHEVVAAGRAHRVWLARWHRHVLCALPADAEFVGEDSHTTCRFGRWHRDLVQGQHSGVHAVLHLGVLHETVHRVGAELALAAGAGARVDAAAYDAFAQDAEAFARAVLDFERNLRVRLGDRHPLTDVPNRRAMEARLRDEIERLKSTPSTACLAMLDLDRFKHLNDTLGHQAGDKVLRELTASIRREIRPYDLLFRYGGDEFLLCLRDVTVDTSMPILERIRERGRAIGAAEGGGNVTLSIGLCELHRDDPVEASIRRADDALYRAKQQGRDRIAVAPDALAPESGA